MFSFLDSIFGSLFSYESNSSGSESEDNSASMVVKGDNNDVDVQQESLKTENEAVSDKSDKEIKEQLRREILTEDLGVVEMIEKCQNLAELRDDEETKEWMEKELTGYGEGEDIPEYRKISVKVDLQIQHSEGTWDLRNDPHDILFGQSALKIEEILEKRQETKLQLAAPPFPKLEEMIDELGLEDAYGRELEKVVYLIDRNELKKLNKGIKTSITSYASSE